MLHRLQEDVTGSGYQLVRHKAVQPRLVVACGSKTQKRLDRFLVLWYYRKMQGRPPLLVGHRRVHKYYEERYRTSNAAVDKKLRQQKDRCALCSRPFAELKRRRRPALDHDHTCCSTLPTCGKCNRGMLCDDCNVTLGFVERIGFDVFYRAAKNYVLKWKLIRQRSK